MGAWGHEAFDNDSACEWLDGLGESLRFMVSHAFWSRYQEEGIAAAALLVELPDRLQEQLSIHMFNEAIEAVENELRPEIVQQWKSPKKRKRYLESLKAALVKRAGKFKPPPKLSKIFVKRRKR